MREPRAFAELETKIGQEEKPAQKPVEAKQDKPKTQLVNKSVDKPVGTSTKGVSVRDWVKKNYPKEYQTDMIRGDLTFDDLGNAMESGDAKDFYSYASEGGKGFDSAVREEIFEGLSKHHGKPYDYYYDIWLNGPKKTAKEEFSFAPDPTDPDLERGYGPGIKDIAYRGDDIQKAKEAEDKRIEGLEAKTDLKPKQDQKGIDAKYKPLYEQMDKEDDELYRRYYYETDPKKKEQLKAELDEHGKKIDALIEEWEQAGKTKPVKSGSFEEAAGKIAKNDKEIGDFNPTEPLYDYQTGAKTASEDEFVLETGNDRPMYDYITKNRDYLYKKAHVDPEGAIKDILRHGSRNFGIDPKNIRKDFAIDVLGGFYEDDGGAPDLSKPEEFKPTEPIESYNDSYDAITRSERNLNVLTANDQGAYDYIVANRDELAKEAEYDPDSVLNKIRWHFQTPGYYKEIKPGNVRKEYLIDVIKNIIEE